ncbi:MAG: hypothetical protein M1833_004766 [Piccolia ochrophora]|nr:MAG: hypothetical protein M1833_004766 [Piccolia ochrophora]
MDSNGLTAETLSPNLAFNWIFLIELLVCGILTLFFLFYFNRLFATLLSYGIRAYTWHKYRVYVDFHALQFSLLGGRVFFKGFKYHGDNETILVHGGYITWQYWHRKVRTAGCLEGLQGASVSAHGGRQPRSSPEISRSRSISGGEKGGSDGSSKLPCRVVLTLQGLEWFVYNRSAAYNAILGDALDQGERSMRRGTDVKRPHKSTSSEGSCGAEDAEDVGGWNGLAPHSTSSSHSEPKGANFRTKLARQFAETKPRLIGTKEETPPLGTLKSKSNSTDASSEKIDTGESPSESAFLRILPIQVDCNKGAVVMGNEHTKSILTAKFSKASCDIDAGRSRTIDKYKQQFNVQLDEPIIQIKPNVDFKESQSSAAARSSQRKGHTHQNPQSTSPTKHWFTLLRSINYVGRGLLSMAITLIPFGLYPSSWDERRTSEASSFPGNPNAEKWKGLSRYLDETLQEEHERWDSIEYGRFSTIFESPRVDMSFYWDVPGLVSTTVAGNDQMGGHSTKDINGDVPPDYGLDLCCRGGVINYGPWADRQRMGLQSIFFPNSYKNAKPARPLRPGQPRVSTKFKILVELEEYTTLRIPTREHSKDWKWKGRPETSQTSHKPVKEKQAKRGVKGKKSAKSNPGPDVRPFGWVDIIVSPDSTISYTMDMMADDWGYNNTLGLDFKHTVLTSSVNHALLLQTGLMNLNCDLSNPREWNALRKWRFDVAASALELFLLRDHIFLLSDLIDDWGSGPPSDYFTFTPFQYTANLKLSDYKLLLNMNDGNIINNPTDMDDNAYAIVKGAELGARVTIPLDKYRTVLNEVSFEAEAERLTLVIHTPTWNPQASFLSPAEVGQMKKLVIEGRYNYYTTTAADLTDTLILDVIGHSASIELYGFLIRDFMTLKDNYFGEDVHFKTFEEYQRPERPLGASGETVQLEMQQKKTNDLDLILSVEIDDLSIMLPANLYSAGECVQLELNVLMLDMRFTNYYMDLDVTFSPLAMSLASIEAGATMPKSVSGTQCFIDGVRIYGHRLFGLPPSEPTYVCHWDIDIGSMTGECSTQFVHQTLFGIHNFAFSFDDDENALPMDHKAVLHDITFLRVRIHPMLLGLYVDQTTLLVSTEVINMTFNDWARNGQSQRLRVDMPKISLACVDADSSSRHRARRHQTVNTKAYVETALELTMIGNKAHFSREQALQQQHVHFHDQRTKRAEFLGLSEEETNTRRFTPRAQIVAPAMPFPPTPAPIRQRARGKSVTSFPSRSGQRQRRRGTSSFSTSLSSATRSQSSGSDSVIRSGAGGGSGKPKTLLETEVPLLTAPTGTRGPQPPFSRHPSVQEARTEHSKQLPSSVAFSSSFMSPYFPLHDIRPNVNDVPEPPSQIQAATETFGNIATGRSSPVEEDVVHTSLIILLPSGVRAFCNPGAIVAVGTTIAELQPQKPTDLLDSLQIEALQKIFDIAKEKTQAGKVTDLTLRIPFSHLRFANTYTDVTHRSAEAGDDHYDLYLSSLSVTTRSATYSPLLQPGKKKHNSAVQLSLRSATLSVKDQTESSSHLHAAVQGSIGEIVFWFHSKERAVASLQFRGAELATQSKKISYLTSLIHRTTQTIDELSTSFSTTSAQQRRRRQYLAYGLIRQGLDMPDPAFLTRPSHVLRTAADHVRLSDSWKIVSRLRHIFHSISEAQQEELQFKCLSNLGNVPPDAQHLVIESLELWRSWELGSVKKSFAMQHLYGSNDESLADQTRVSAPVEASIEAGQVKLLLDPGPKQSQVVLDNLSLGIAENVPDMATGALPTAISSSAKTTAVHVHCDKVNVGLSWELLELAEGLLKVYKEDEVKPQGARTTASRPPKSSGERYYHIVVITETGAITMDGINLRCISVSRNLEGSVVVSNQHGKKQTVTSNVLLHADAASSEFVSHSRILTLSKLRNPSLYLSYSSEHRDQDTVNHFALAGSCQELSYTVQEELLGVMETLNHIMIDEVAYISQIAKTYNSAQKNDTAASTPDRRTISQFNVALFLQEYSIDVALLQSMRYIITGKVARLSVHPQRDSVVILHFDLKEQRHEVQMRGKQKSEMISLLHVPPINGHIVSETTDIEMSFVAFISLERVLIDASAIHSLLVVLNRQDVSNVVKDVRADIGLVKSHFQEIFDKDERQKHAQRPTRSKSIIYNAHITSGGLCVYASAPVTQARYESAKVELILGSFQARAANRQDSTGPPLEFPEMRIGLRKLGVELTRMEQGKPQPCGNLQFGAFVNCSSKDNEAGELVRAYYAKSRALEINIFAETASSVVDVLGHLQSRIKDLEFTREAHYLRRLRKFRPKSMLEGSREAEKIANSTSLFSAIYSLEMSNVQVSWIVGESTPPSQEIEDLVLSFGRIELATSKQNAARLTFEDFQLQMVPVSHSKRERSLNSALLPEVVFNVAYLSTPGDRRLAFQAAGKSLDLRLTSEFILPASELKSSIATASDKLRAAALTWDAIPSKGGGERTTLFGNKRLASLLVDADFAGAVVYVQGKKVPESQRPALSMLRGGRVPQHGRYGQFAHEDASSSTTLRAPGIAVKVEYKDISDKDPSLNAEMKIDASTNILYPTVVPLILEMSTSIKAVMGDSASRDTPPPQKAQDADNKMTSDPSVVLGRVKLNLGLRIAKQEFSLSCQPIARVAATAKFEDIYITCNTVESAEHGHFFAVSATFSHLQASVQHVYSRESTGNFDIESIVLSLMNSKHLSGVGGLSVILKISPTNALINARQLHDFLLFREIWIPLEIRQSRSGPTASTPADTQSFLVQQYQQVAAAKAFPWNAAVSIASIHVQLDLGQSLGKSSFHISELWSSSKKSSDWEQNLCLGFDKISVEGDGRMGGLVELQKFKVRTSIRWPSGEASGGETPVIQASAGFAMLQVKVAFDYQAFLVANASSFEFLMYNVRDAHSGNTDRLVGILNGDKVQAFCTATSAAQAVGLYQAVLRLVQEKRAAFEASIKDIEKFLRRKSTVGPPPSPQKSVESPPKADKKSHSAPITLHTDVVVTLREVNVGAYPSTFVDNQVFKMQALNAQARFAATLEKGRIHSGLGLKLGQLRVALSTISRTTSPKGAADVGIEDVVKDVIDSRGGTILRVPRVVATMQTWQDPGSTHIDYIFRSSFEGKVDVGWNYSRISFIRGMWNNHSRNLAQRLGKPISHSAVKITGGPQPDFTPPGGAASSGDGVRDTEHGKITAVVNVPQSKYDYTALEPPVIETPQLRDMGEATPPLEWIGLHRERLPTLTHQIVIVSLLEVAREVEDAYGRILGSS